MRTTLDLDADIVQVARQLASQRRATMGQVISDLARRGLQPTSCPVMRNGVPLLRPKKGAVPPTLELINRLRDEE
jgi:hypothetical protein